MKNPTFACLLLIALCANTCWSESMRVVASSPLEKVLRTAAPDKTAPPELTLEGAAGETVSAQAVVVPGGADTIRARIAGLKTADGKASISAGGIRLQWVRYMDITANTAAVPKDELVAVAPASIPDPFWEDAELRVTPGAVQPLWIEVDIPADARPGEYRGDLSVSSKSGKCSLPVALKVRRFTLRAEPHQRVIQWWDVPGRTFEQFKPGTDAYWKHLQGMCELVRRHRQTDVRVSWSLVQRKSDGSWDTSLLEKYIDVAFSTGLQAVHFEGAGRHTKSVVEPDSRTEPVEDNMGRLAAVENLVVKRKWLGRVLTSLADEPFIFQEQSYRKLTEQVRKVAPHVGIVEAIETDDIGDMDIYVPKLSHLNLWWPRFAELKREGKTVWFYTCCHPQGRYPNRFLDQTLTSARELHWISYLFDLDGYLHWGLNWFAADLDPYSEKGSTQWGLPPGDSQVAYPGRNGWVGSLRLSAMRDGLQDYEYLWTLESKVRLLKNRLAKEGAWIDPRQRPLELCRRVVQSFYDHTRDPKVLLDTRSAIADEIEALDATPLLYVQTSPPDGSVTPEGPIMINIRGAASPGAKITINGQPVIPANVSAKGCFIGEAFIGKKNPEVLVRAEFNGAVCECKRTFVVQD